MRDYGSGSVQISIETSNGPASTTALALKGLRFIVAATTSGGVGGAPGWPAVEERFDLLAASSSSDGLLHRSLFGQCIGLSKQSEDGLGGILFHAAARRHSTIGYCITKEQLRGFWEAMSDENFDTRIRIFFDMVEKDSDGKFTAEEVKEIIRLGTSASKYSTIKEETEEYTALLIKELDPESTGLVTIHDLEALLLQAPSISIKAGEKNRFPEAQRSEPVSVGCRHWLMRLVVFGLWFGVIAGLFMYKFMEYYRRKTTGNSACVPIHKGAAETLKFNFAVILLPFCIITVTWLRNVMVAFGILVGVAVHLFFHLFCEVLVVVNLNEAEYEPLKPVFGDKQPYDYKYFLTGVLGITGIAMLGLMLIAYARACCCCHQNSLKSTRKYWYSHLLFVAVYILLVIHGSSLRYEKKWYRKTTWMYLAFPVTLYVGEKILRAYRSGNNAVKILKVRAHPADVLELHISKPDRFSYWVGQYVFVNFPGVSSLQWHPCALSLGPRNDCLILQVTGRGKWSEQLKSKFSKACQVSEGAGDGVGEVGFARGGVDDFQFPEMKIDGPYGKTIHGYRNYKTVLLVGQGIEATPVISILKDIIAEFSVEGQECPSFEATLESGRAGKSTPLNRINWANTEAFRVKKAYFHWVAKEKDSLEYFQEVMNEISEMDGCKCLDLHCHGERPSSALASMVHALQWAEKNASNGRATQAKIHFKKPDWSVLFQKLANRHPDTAVGVFFCGRGKLEKELEQRALQMSQSGSTKFDFHRAKFVK